MTKIAIFDVCETLISLQTADNFTDFILTKFNYQRRQKQLLFLERIKFFVLMQKYFPKLLVEKRLRLFQLRGIPECELEQAAAEYFIFLKENHVIEATFKEYKRLQSLGYYMILLSAGYDIYLKFLAQFLDAQLICNNLVFKKNKFSGFINKVDCSRENKVQYIKEFISMKNLQLGEVVAYGDSFEDRYILSWSKSGVIVLRSDRNNWDRERKFRVITWQ